MSKRDPLSKRDVRILAEAMDICEELGWKPPLDDDTPFDTHMHLCRGRLIGLAEAAKTLLSDLLLDAGVSGSENASEWWEERYPPRRKRTTKTKEAP